MRSFLSCRRRGTGRRSVNSDPGEGIGGVAVECLRSSTGLWPAVCRISGVYEVVPRYLARVLSRFLIAVRAGFPDMIVIQS